MRTLAAGGIISISGFIAMDWANMSSSAMISAPTSFMTAQYLALSREPSSAAGARARRDRPRGGRRAVLGGGARAFLAAAAASPIGTVGVAHLPPGLLHLALTGGGGTLELLSLYLKVVCKTTFVREDEGG